MNMSIPKQDYDLLIKIKLDGSVDVGKSSILNRYAQNIFEQYNCSIGVDFKFKKIEKFDKQIKLQIWDINGSERFRTLTYSSIRSLKGLILVYDITDRNSFQSIKSYMDIYQKLDDESNIVFMLVGNKCDLDKDRNVSYSEGQQLADSFGIQFFEVSAKNCDNVDLSFDALTNQILLRN